MSIRSVICSAALGAGIMAHGAANAATVDVVLRSNSIDTSFQTVALEAGTWDIGLLATFTGLGFISWNPWGMTAGCVSGANCARGWLNDFRITTSDGTSVGVNVPRVAYGTPELARNNFKPFEFVLGQAGDVVFSISDGQTDVGQYANNLGGLSLRLTLRDAPVPPPQDDDIAYIPTPAALPLLLAGVLALFGVGRKRRSA